MEEKYDNIELLSTSVMVTEVCTLKCKLCLSYSPYYEKKYVMGVKEAESIMKRYFSIIDSVEKFSITGGEPLTNKNIDKILEIIYSYSNKIKKEIIFITNGTLLISGKLLKLFIKNRTKTKVIVNNYGEGLSKLAEKNYSVLKENGIKTIFYDESNRYGWIDCRDHSLKHKKAVEIRKQSSNCEFFIGKKYIINRGGLYTCTRSFYRMHKGIIPINNSEYIDLTNDKIPLKESKNRIIKMLNLPNTTACAYCNGLLENTTKYKAAEQL